MDAQASRTMMIRVLSWLLAVLLPVGGSYADTQSAGQGEVESCDSAESCFRLGAVPKERLGKALGKDQLLSLKLDRLQRVVERYPSTLWAKRAGLLSGVLLVERNPAVALQYLRAAQRDFPVLDDYIRLWIGEALLNLGDAKEAATIFESIALAVPDSNILGKAAYRAGEAWYQASSCTQAGEWFARAVQMSDKEPSTPLALLRRAACELRENRITEGRETLKQLWVRFPSSAEAREAETLLSSNLGGEPWQPQPGERLTRAQAFLGQAFHAEAIGELQKFLAADPHSPRRAEAKLKLGIAQVRLKQYDLARETFRGLLKDHGSESQEAAVWLARVLLRQNQGEKLLEVARMAQNASLSAEQKGQIDLFAGIWFEDQKQFDDAIARYRLVAKFGEPSSQRAEALWRVGWVYYRTGRYRESIEIWRTLVEHHDSEFEPQALYWMGRASETMQPAQAAETFGQLCRRFVYTYYCQLARERTQLSTTQEPPETTTNGDSASVAAATVSTVNRSEIQQHNAYRRAVELRALGLDLDAAREVGVLADRYTKEPASLIALSMLLNEVGAYHHALRLARSRFRDQLERTGGIVSPSLWTVAYPTGLLSTIKLQGARGVDPYLIAAIIREESQYDLKAVSRVGAIGLMQVMPATANTVAQRVGIPTVGREDLFDQETNIRIGVRYVEQLLEQFSGNLVYTVAAYNAGPLAVNSWLAQYRQTSPDEFVELIPYQETRQYVKRVIRSYREYIRLSNHF
ncbi:MAG TPA: transglycosylase SLT domain-containing protein [Nitrospira sp.]|nr:transglycosylase SLT domain-containing protein [Nitrospira sp.]